MNIKKVLLSIDAIKEIPIEKYHKDFTFVVNGKEYHTSRIVADILSPIIRQYHYTDETINTFYIETNNKNAQTDFSLILSLISFQQKNLYQEELEFFIGILSILGNEKEIQKILPKYEDKITLQNVFSRIHLKQKYIQALNNKNDQKSFKKEIIQNETFSNILYEELKPEFDFISKHFFEIDKNELQKLELNQIEWILKNDEIKLEDEDSLLKIVNELYTQDHRYSILFEYINFLNVSQNQLFHFFELFDLDDINHRIWKSIVERAMKFQVTEKDKKIKNFVRKHQIKDNSIKNDKSDQIKTELIDKKGQIKIEIKDEVITDTNPQFQEIQILHNKNDEFNGIVKYLTNKAGCNLHEKGIIEVTSNSFFSHPKYLLDFDTEHYYQAGKTDAWVCFDFKNKKVKLTNYSIKSNSGGENLYHLKSWEIEVSDDGQSWTKIDEKKNCPALNGSYVTGTFETSPINDYSRFVRIHQTDSPWGGGCLWFCYIEFYGYLQEE